MLFRSFVSTPADGSPLVAVASVFGNPGYLVPYAAALVGSFVAMHVIWERVEAHGLGR